MNETDILTKTAAGSNEIKSRARQLPPRLRGLLIMVDGARSVAQLRQAAAQLGAAADAVEALLQMGLVQSPEPAEAPAPSAEPRKAATEAERFRAAQKFMNDTAVDALGLRAFFFTLKLERCSSCDDLRAVLPDFAKAVTKGGGADFGGTAQARATEMLR